VTDPQCRRAYRIDDGIPVLLVDEFPFTPELIRRSGHGTAA